MKKRNILFIVAIFLCITTCLVFASCKEDENTATQPSQQSGSQSGSDQTTNPTQPALPTAEEIVSARKASSDANKQEYDFLLNLSGSATILGFPLSLNGNYDGSYRYDKTTNDLKFKRETSGAIFVDSTEYIYNEGDTKIKVKMNESGEVKKVSMASAQDEELTLINKPIVEFIDSLNAKSFTNITKTSNGSYQYQSNLKVSADNIYLAKILSIMGNLGTDIAIKNVTFTNPTSGFVLYFNLADGKLDDFALKMEIKFPVKGVDVTVSLNYAQKGNNASISIPSTSGILVNSQAISTALNEIENSITSLQNDGTYSIDTTAKNVLDPGFSKTAVTDQFISRFYKNTNGSDVSFNHSYKYKAHSETDGKESYTYTVGNIKSGEVYQISRKGTNTNKQVTETYSSIFESLTSYLHYNASDVDCIRKVTKNGSTFYYVYLNNAKGTTLQQSITDVINSNEASDALKVNNYFNENDYTMEESEIVIEVKNGKLVNAECKTQMKYSPTDGEYADYSVTLDNEISIEINKNLEKASEYEAPQSVTTSIGKIGLNNAKYYILP